MIDYFEATLKLGIPMALMAWWVYSWLYRTERIDPTGSRKENEAQLKAMRKEKIAAQKESGQTVPRTEPEDFWLEKWLWMGGGFYGLAALWTLIVLEILELFGFVAKLPSFISSFTGGPVDLLVTFVISQIQNLVAAFVWVTYWDNGFSLIWFVIAYVGYLMGRELAKRKDAKEFFGQIMQRG